MQPRARLQLFYAPSTGKQPGEPAPCPLNSLAAFSKIVFVQHLIIFHSKAMIHNSPFDLMTLHSLYLWTNKNSTSHVTFSPIQIILSQKPKPTSLLIFKTYNSTSPLLMQCQTKRKKPVSSKSGSKSQNSPTTTPKNKTRFIYSNQIPNALITFYHFKERKGIQFLPISSNKSNHRNSMRN